MSSTSSTDLPVHGTAAGVPAARIALAAPAAQTVVPGPIDGAWWPRSLDLAAEFPALAAAVRAQTDRRVVHLVYDRALWLPAPHRLVERTGYVKAGWFATADPHQVALRLSNGLRLVLLVVPPETPRAQAEWAMQHSVDPANVLGSEALLRTAVSRGV